MLFSGIPFLCAFLPATVILYFVAPKRLRNAVLLLASMVFYAWGEQRLVVLFAATILAGWLLGLLIERFHGRPVAVFWLVLSVTVDLALLGYFKYVDFFAESLNAVFGLSLPLLHVALPIGISFYIFQILSYTVDVYRGTVPAQRNIINFACYVALFPQLIAGPIVRYSDIAVQLTERKTTVSMAADGTRRFILGLAKKVLIANVMGELCAGFRSAAELSVLYYWLYAFAFALQIYFDFSGYSDMAIGLGKLFGFTFMENFNYPYISRSITEFWRRWHISLGSWFRDYVYIPLGGNRKGIWRQILNILIVWSLTGLWHGAAWNFVLWGGFFAVLLIAEKLFLKKALDRVPIVGHVYTLAMVLLGFILFNASDLTEALQDVAGLFAFGKLPFATQESLYALRSFGVTMAIAVIGATPLPKMLAIKLQDKKAMTILEPLFLTVLLLLCLAFLVDGSFNPFLYFRF